MSDTPLPGTDAATIALLRQVKAVEAEWEEKLRAARADAEAALEQVRTSAEAEVRALVAQLEVDRSRALEAAGDLAEQEARDIVKAGESAAAKTRSGTGKKTAARKDELVAAVLGEFAAP